MPVNVSENVTANIRAELARRGRTQGDLAEALGMHPMTISKRMTGQADWWIGEIPAAADWLGIPLAALFGAAS